MRTTLKTVTIREEAVSKTVEFGDDEASKLRPYCAPPPTKSMKMEMAPVIVFLAIAPFIVIPLFCQ